jgi:hypothetical protein
VADGDLQAGYHTRASRGGGEGSTAHAHEASKGLGRVDVVPYRVPCPSAEDSSARLYLHPSEDHRWRFGRVRTHLCETLVTLTGRFPAFLSHLPIPPFSLALLLFPRHLTDCRSLPVNVLAAMRPVAFPAPVPLAVRPVPVPLAFALSIRRVVAGPVRPIIVTPFMFPLTLPQLPLLPPASPLLALLLGLVVISVSVSSLPITVILPATSISTSSPLAFAFALAVSLLTMTTVSALPLAVLVVFFAFVTPVPPMRTVTIIFVVLTMALLTFTADVSDTDYKDTRLQSCSAVREGEGEEAITYEASSGVRSLPFKGPECGGVSDIGQVLRVESPKAFRGFTGVCPLEACCAERQLFGRLVDG